MGKIIADKSDFPLVQMVTGDAVSMVDGKLVVDAALGRDMVKKEPVTLAFERLDTTMTVEKQGVRIALKVFFEDGTLQVGFD